MNNLFNIVNNIINNNIINIIIIIINIINNNIFNVNEVPPPPIVRQNGSFNLNKYTNLHIIH